MASKEPVTLTGWYENTDESWSYYAWHGGLVREELRLPAGVERPSRAEMDAAITPPRERVDDASELAARFDARPWIVLWGRERR